MSELATSAPPVESVTPGAPVRWLLRLLALSAAGVAGYLLWISLTKGSLPLGCGAGEGCAEVLTSPWSRVGPVPVSAPALLLYLGLLTATGFIGPRQPAVRRRVAWGVLLTLSTAVVAAATWFIAIQAFEIEQYCTWCLADHALGLLFAGIVLFSAPVRWRGAAIDDGISLRGSLAARLGFVGAFLTAGLAIAQLALPYRPPAASRLPAGQSGDTGPGPDRAVALFDGKFQFSPHELPTLGSPDSPHLAVLMLDYCCPHCQATHGYLLHALARYPGQLGIVALPVPFSRECNPNLQSTESRFEHSCSLARLALAVWRADPAAWPEFDRWLYESEQPREPLDAREKALTLVSAEALERAQTDPWINEQLQRNIQAHQDSKAGRVPAIFSPAPGFRPIDARPESEAWLFAEFEKGLGLKAVGDPPAESEPTGNGSGGEATRDADADAIEADSDAR